ncbi:MAG TPA: TIGR04283 family arsenosugar biosynthesis glycosyltransferase [Alphaproteobacteria bacterium]|nr:TIGR04283 family arsenosugar biosynthesis glycosyltransferase [Alphaproteobacteria bacterium]
MISVIIPTLNAGDSVRRAIDQFKTQLIKEVIVVDGGSSDATAEIARASGARVIETHRGRGPQLMAGADAAEGDWYLFLHVDTRLGSGWEGDISTFLSKPNNRLRGAVFRFQLEDDSPQARRLERIVAWRNRTFDLPYGDQGLLIHRILYDVVGGFRPLPLMEDVDFMRRLNGRFIEFETPAITSAERYRQEGYMKRPVRNLLCLGLYYLGVSPDRLVDFYN